MGGHTYQPPTPPSPPTPPKTDHVPTRGTDERHTIRELADHRGGNFLVRMFDGTIVDAKTLADAYHGRPIASAQFTAIKRLFAEQMTRD